MPYLVDEPTLPTAPAILPDHEPAALPIVDAAARRKVVAQIAGLEKTLSYMGERHTQRAPLEGRLQGLRQLLTRWDNTLRVYAGRQSSLTASAKRMP